MKIWIKALFRLEEYFLLYLTTEQQQKPLRVYITFKLHI